MDLLISSMNINNNNNNNNIVNVLTTGLLPKFRDPGYTLPVIGANPKHVYSMIVLILGDCINYPLITQC